MSKGQSDGNNEWPLAHVMYASPRTYKARAKRCRVGIRGVCHAYTRALGSANKRVNPNERSFQPLRLTRARPLRNYEEDPARFPERLGLLYGGRGFHPCLSSRESLMCRGVCPQGASEKKGRTKKKNKHRFALKSFN